METDARKLQAAALSDDPAVFSAYLKQTGQPFLLLGDLHEQRARLRFTGPLEAVEVVWDCEFVTLESLLRSGPTQPRGEAATLRNFIEIGEAGERGVPLRVGLDLPRIDRSAILKMIVMIRNYKRLRPGRHEFGAPSHILPAGQPPS